MNLNYLHYFHILTEELSFSGTAKRLRIAQPAVSTAIKKLEEQLGVQLFLRQNRRVVLTTEGEKLKNHAGEALKRIHQVYAELQGEQEAMRGTLRIGSLQEFGELVLEPLLSSFAMCYPDLRVDVVYASNAKLMEMLRDDQIDAHFGIAVTPFGNLAAHLLLKQQSFLVTGRQSHREPSMNALLKSQFVAYQVNDPLLTLYLKTFYPKQSFEQLNLKFVCNSHKTMVELISQNSHLYAVLPWLSQPVFAGLQSGRLVRVRQHALTSNIFLYTWQRQHVPLRLSSFLLHAKSFDYLSILEGS